MSGGGGGHYLEGDNYIYMVGHLSRCGRGSFLVSQTYNWKEQLASPTARVLQLQQATHAQLALGLASSN